MNKSIKIIHPFAPVYNAESKILILGTIASPKSREYGFFYGHPQNSFWRVLANIFDIAFPESIEDKTRFLLENKIALWDVLHSCEITGADDNSIKNPVVNNFSEILNGSEIKNIFTTGKTATRLYDKYCFKDTNIPAFYLPSTSAANRKYYNFDKLCEEYKIIKKLLT